MEVEYQGRRWRTVSYERGTKKLRRSNARIAFHMIL